MAAGSVADFLTLLEKSRLLSGEQLATAHRLAAGAADPPGLAKTLVGEKLLSRWQAAQLLAGRSTLLLGKYKLIQLLGHGGMGRVFLAEHVTMNRRVALKIVPRHVANDRAALERFFAEARAIAALDHPNIVQAYSVDNECDRYFIVMEYVDGQDLQRMVEIEGPLGFERAADYIRQAADGLGHAHSHNLVHCDIKPSNLLLNPQGVVKILDMGLVRLGSREEEAAGGRPANGFGRPEEQALGSVDYLAPEQALGTPDFDHRADIYALGCTFYFLLTGHPPFPEGTLAQRIVKHQTQQPRDVLLERPDTPGELAAICRRMMAKRPEDRYASAAEASRALLAWRPEAHAMAAGNPLRLSRHSDEEISAAEAGSGAWLDSMAVPSVVDRPKRPSAEGEAKPKLPRRVLAATAASVKRGLGWFNTPRRKVFGATAAALLVLVPTLAATIAVVGSRSRAAGGTTPAPAKSDLHRKKAPQAPEEGPQGAALKEKLTESESPEEKPEPKTEPKIEPKATPTPKPEAKPEVKPEPKSEPKPEPKPEVKPEPKSEPKPPPKEKPPEKPPPKPATSLASLAPAVTVPIVGKDAAADAQPVSLGKFQADAQAALDVKLLGGGTAGGRQRFALRTAAGKEAPGWYVSTGSGDDPTSIARVWREAAEMKFQWLGDATAGSNYLRNCGLLLACEGQTHLTALSQPVTTDPLVFDLTKGNAEVRLTRENLPDPAQLRLKVFVLDKGFPSHTMKVDGGGRKVEGGGRKAKGNPADSAAGAGGGDTVAGGGTVLLDLTTQKSLHNALRIRFDAKRPLLHMVWEVTVFGRETVFNEARLRALEANAQGMEAAAEAFSKSPKSKKTPAGGDPTKAAKDFREHVSALGALAGEIKNRKIDFQVFLPLSKPGENPHCNLVLFQSAEPPQGEAKKK
jgi:serine/threonine protein kinase